MSTDDKNRTYGDRLKMEPEALIEILKDEAGYRQPVEAGSDRDRSLLAQEIQKANAFFAYYSEMELQARVLKRKAKRDKDKDEADRLLGVEEVFKTYKEIASKHIDACAKMMTLKRLELDEAKQFGRQ